MTVQELIAELSKQDPEATVKKTNWEGFYPGGYDSFEEPVVFRDEEDLKLVWV